jgi:hypothetical protein
MPRPGFISKSRFAATRPTGRGLAAANARLEVESLVGRGAASTELLLPGSVYRVRGAAVASPTDPAAIVVAWRMG